MIDKTKKQWFIVENSEGAEIIHVIWDEAQNYQIGGKKWSSRSAPKNTRKELMEDNKVLDKPCAKCGRLVQSHYHNNEKMIKLNLCFNCNFWDDKIAIKGNDNVARIKGTHYTILPDSPGHGFKGFGGALFLIKFFDGRNATTHNLWCQGNISKHYVDVLPDNATFVTPVGESVKDAMIAANKN